MITTDDDDSDTLIRNSKAAERVRRVRASFQHLLDLKRGNYSPRFTELVVDAHDRIVALPQRRPMRWQRPKPIVETMLLRRKQRL